MSLVIQPDLDDVRKLMSLAEDTLSDDQLEQFQNYLLNQPHVMDKYFHWNGNFDQWHDDFEQFQTLKNIIKLED